MAGWNVKQGLLSDRNVSDDEYWSIFNYVFSDYCHKRNTYKFALIKAILDNLFSAIPQKSTYYISYLDLFSKFAENYWNLIVKYQLCQITKSSGTEHSAIEKIFCEAVSANPVLKEIEFESIESTTRYHIIMDVIKECRKYVIGALYSDFKGTVYSFDISSNEGIFISGQAFEFMMKYKSDIEKINYYSWAKFLEKINDESHISHLIEKLNLATPTRNNLDIFRLTLQKEFEECNCFYCGRKLAKVPDVDHFIPWSFMKTDNLWNFVLSCKTCNSKKRERLPSSEMMTKLISRNNMGSLSKDEFVRNQFKSYDENRLKRLWAYAQLSGYRIIVSGKL